MELLKTGTELAAGDIEVSGVTPGTPIVITEAVGELPHGYAYKGKLGHHKVLVTVYDPSALADPEAKDGLLRGLSWARELRHGNLLPTLGWIEGDTLYSVRDDPDCATVRQLIHERMAQGKRTDIETACSLGAQICDALGKLHPTVLHLYVNPDTVYVTADGRALLSATGEGALLPGAPGFERFHRAGLLPNAAPELTEKPPRPVLETDVFGVGALVAEMLAGRTIERAGQNIPDLGFAGPDHLLMCLQQAIEPDPHSRQPNILNLRAELLEAARAKAPQPPPLPPRAPSPPPIGMPGEMGGPGLWGPDPGYDLGAVPAPVPHPSPPMEPPPPRPPEFGAAGPPPPPRATSPPASERHQASASTPEALGRPASGPRPPRDPNAVPDHPGRPKRRTGARSRRRRAA